MDGRRFDALTKAWALGTSRRRLLGGVLGAVLGGAGWRAVAAACPSGMVCSAQCCPNASDICLAGRCTSCPSGIVCSATCCPNAGDVCISGQCTSCPSGVVCSGECCAAGETCQAGRCADAPPTTTTPAPTRTTTTTARPGTTTSTTTARPRTTTTTPPPTTTTTAPPTTTTTTTVAPSCPAGSCPAGTSFCTGYDAFCGDRPVCSCFQSVEGTTVCASAVDIDCRTTCRSSAECEAGASCVVLTGPACADCGVSATCLPCCSTPVPPTTTTTTTQMCLSLGTSCRADDDCCSGSCCGNICRPACEAGHACCDGDCIDIQADVHNCGACGHACGTGQACCAGVCVDERSDLNNCGSCGHVCRHGNDCNANTCAAGVCGTSPVTDGTPCHGGQGRCRSGICVTSSPPHACADKFVGANCGHGIAFCLCERDVDGSDVCASVGGACTAVACMSDDDCATFGHPGYACTRQPGCPSGTACSPYCACPPTYICGGVCLAAPCDASQCQTCDPKSGTCVFCDDGTQNQVCCSGTCAAESITNCGRCGNTCAGPTSGPGHPICNSGQCQISCDTGYTACGTACIDTSSDLNNCGSCGHVCRVGNDCDRRTCAAGKCGTTPVANGAPCHGGQGTCQNAKCVTSSTYSCADQRYHVGCGPNFNCYCGADMDGSKVCAEVGGLRCTYRELDGRPVAAPCVSDDDCATFGVPGYACVNYSACLSGTACVPYCAA